MKDLTGKQVQWMDFCAWPDTMMGVVFASDIPQNESFICIAFIFTFSWVTKYVIQNFEDHICISGIWGRTNNSELLCVM